MLEKGWNYGQGDVIDDSIIKQALQVYKFGKDQGFDAEVFPIINGGIEISFIKGNNALDITINPDTIMDLTWEQGIGQDYEVLDEKENVDFEDLNYFFNKIREECLSSESFIYETITPINEDFRKQYSLTLQEMAESPLLIYCVSAKSDPVNIYTNTTQTQLVAP